MVSGDNTEHNNNAKKPRAYISFELKKMKKHKFVTVIGQQVIKQFPDNIQTNSRFI